MKKQAGKADCIELLKRSACPVTNSLEIIGDKWTLVVIRDLFFGKKTYSDFQASPEGIPTNILAERLKRLECSGIIEKIPYQSKPVRYEYRLTDKGQDLRGVLKALKDWGLKHIPGTEAKLTRQTQ
jgi:DNA-binding HxlR family transcriptional regulator